jgi:indole-3-glycerol phosphate synthase
MSSIPVLDQILDRVRERLQEERVRRPLAELRRGISRRPGDFRQHLLRSPAPRVIAEVKRQSPSAGAIAPHADPLRVAAAYRQSGAAALSVLTERDHFGGSPETLQAIRAAHPEAPLLMKDFVIDEYQLVRAAHDGADAVLLILAALGPLRCRELQQQAAALGLSVLVEVHDEAELDDALALGAELIGVNNRNLRTMQVSLTVSERLSRRVPPHVTLVSESGLRSGADLQRLAALGYHAFLVGTSLMQASDPGAALARLRAEAAA